MPRFEQEGFDPRRRRENDALDRTVPEEDRHLDPEVDLDFNRRQRDVIDRQDESGINPCDYRDPYAPSAPYNQNNDHDPNGYIEPPAPPRRFESDRPQIFIRTGATRLRPRVPTTGSGQAVTPHRGPQPYPH